jgi:hypothetical protein
MLDDLDPTYDRTQLISVHLVETGIRSALGALRARPNPDLIEGLTWAETWLSTPLRKGALPSTDVKGAALIAAWKDDEALDRFLEHPAARPYRQGWSARFEPIRTIGAWPGLPDLPRQEKQVGNDEPVAVLTMARVRLHRFPAFAAAAGAAERDAVFHPAFLEGTSLLRPASLVATLSLWRSTKEMRQYTVGSYPGGHTRAMKAHSEQEFHHETMFVRLRPYAVEGVWNGRNPLATLGAGPAPARDDHAGEAVEAVTGNGEARD